MLAEGVRLHPGLGLDLVTVLKDDLDEARKEDIRVIWDAFKDHARAAEEWTTLCDACSKAI